METINLKEILFTGKKPFYLFFHFPLKIMQALQMENVGGCVSSLFSWQVMPEE